MQPGTRLGNYEIVAPLGAGGMGEVYRARDTRLSREVALKVLPVDVAADAGRRARFEREARAVFGLNHPNIVTLFSVEDGGDSRFLTMELVEGRGLDHHIASGGLPVARVVELGITMTDALTAAHEKGVVHRDFKPASVMADRHARRRKGGHLWYTADNTTFDYLETFRLDRAGQCGIGYRPEHASATCVPTVQFRVSLPVEG